MKTSTIMWTLAVLIIILGAGAYFYMATPAVAPTTTAQTTTTATNTTPSNLPEGDMAPTPSTPIASSSASINASTTGY